MSYLSTHKIKSALIAVVAVGLVAAVPSLMSSSPATAQVDGPSKEALSTLNNLSEAFVGLSAEASPAVVSIRVKKDMSRDMQPTQGPGMTPGDLFERFFGPGFQIPGGPDSPAPGGTPFAYGEGTGFIMSDDGYVVTNSHVVDGADVVEVRLDDGREFDAEVIGSDPQTEVALIKVEAKDLPTLKFGDSDAIQVGEWVVAIGSPFGLQHTVTAGIVSARGRGDVGIVDYADFIQTDAAINPGNSGGPLLNLNGEVIGMNTAILSRSGGNMGIGFAIPINMVRYVVDELREDGAVTRGFLGIGIQNLTPDLAEWFNVDESQGVLVASVVPDTPADRAGLKKDDVIVEYEGKPVVASGSFRSHVATTPAGEKVDLTIIRNGERMTKQVTIGEMEGDAMKSTGGAAVQAEAQGRKIGITIENLTNETAQRLGYENKSGVVIGQVVRGSAAAMAGLRPGMLITEVNRQPVQNVNDFRQAMDKGDEGRGTLLRVEDAEGGSRYVTIK
ncbi:MAG: DegQ family serine endoprotease [Candidatus Hydrogenedentes bacterium]|nr:DegQ family serine endoprotease [Candidatus Hydrogenedentota bacterium]